MIVSVPIVCLTMPLSYIAANSQQPSPVTEELHHFIYICFLGRYCWWRLSCWERSQPKTLRRSWNTKSNLLPQVAERSWLRVFPFRVQNVTPQLLVSSSLCSHKQKSKNSGEPMLAVSNFPCGLGISANGDRIFSEPARQGSKGLKQDTDILDNMGTRPPLL